MCYKQLGELEKAQFFYEETLKEICSKKRDDEEDEKAKKSVVFNNMGTVRYSQGLLNEAMQYYK